MQRAMLTDTHAHLCDPSLEGDLAGVLARAREQGVGQVISVSEDPEEASQNLELAESFPGIFPAAGLYPGKADRSQALALQDLVRQQRDRLTALGEVGLDYRIAETEEDRELQREVLTLFISLSLELDLPLNVHSRSAGRHAADLLLEQGARLVQMHAFDGKAASARPAVEAGYFFSVPPSAVRSRQKQKLIRQLPLSCLLPETDSPVLGPSPEQVNEPCNLHHSLQKIAELKEMETSRVQDAVLENTRRLYGEISSP